MNKSSEASRILGFLVSGLIGIIGLLLVLVAFIAGIKGGNLAAFLVVAAPGALCLFLAYRFFKRPQADASVRPVADTAIKDPKLRRFASVFSTTSLIASMVFALYFIQFISLFCR